MSHNPSQLAKYKILVMGMTPSFFTHFCQAKKQSHDFQSTYSIKRLHLL